MSGGNDIAAPQKFSNTPGQATRPEPGPHRPRYPRRHVAHPHGYGYRNKVYPTTDLSETLAQNGYGLWTAGLVWERARHWTLSLHGSNLRDVRYRTDGDYVPAVFILDGFYGPPRQ